MEHCTLATTDRITSDNLRCDIIIIIVFGVLDYFHKYIYIIFYLMFCGIFWKFSYFYFTFVMDLTVLETCFLFSVSNC